MDSLKIIDSNKITEKTISKYIPRMSTELDSIRDSVMEIITEVKLNKDSALIKFSKKFDNVDLKQSEIKVSQEEITEAYNQIDEKLLSALKYAKKNLIKFHKAQKRQDWTIEIERGVKAGQIYRPLESIGIYIPGGKAIYPSTVLMAVTPAFIAGVQNIIICSPPQENKKIAPEILVAAKEFEINRIFKVGGAQAIAAMAFGTETIPKVQKIIGPGNKWVNTAKQLLATQVAIDTPAGPSEILIIADDSVDYKFVIVDLLSQIEHDPENIGILVSNSEKLIENVKNNIEYYVENAERKEIIKTALIKNSLIIKAKNIDDCIRISNLIAPEHLEILIKNPKTILEKISNAGAIFLGINSPVPLGDYSAGTNHILPTGGNAKKYSGLNIYDFLKIIDVLECTREGLISLSESSSIIAEYENLFYHKKSIQERLKDKN
ncbi:MAG: histidinol dehydrogenase [Promethearchaeota archaeon]